MLAKIVTIKLDIYTCNPDLLLIHLFYVKGGI